MKRFFYTFLYSLMRGNGFETFKCWFIRKTRTVKGTKLININDLIHGHESSPAHPRTAERINRLLDKINNLPPQLTTSQMEQFIESDDPITVTKQNIIINGNGRVMALKSVGYKGNIEVQIV